MIRYPHDEQANASADLFDVLNRLAERWRLKELERQIRERLADMLLIVLTKDGAVATLSPVISRTEILALLEKEKPCCSNEQRTFAGGCKNCGDPSF